MGPVDDMDGQRLLTLRTDYESGGLARSDLTDDPSEIFARWFSEALESGLVEPHAFVLATADREARPSARTVLMREMDRRGIVFYTNYRSRKGADLAENPRASGVFLWMPLHRQVRIEGRVERVPGAQSDAYFSARPPGSTSERGRLSPERSGSRPGLVGGADGKRSGAATPMEMSRDRRNGAATGWPPTATSFGRVVPTASTTGSNTDGATVAGWCGTTRSLIWSEWRGRGIAIPSEPVQRDCFFDASGV